MNKFAKHLAMEIMTASRSRVGESPAWVAAEGALYWSDLRDHLVRRLVIDGDDETAIAFDRPVAAPLPLAGGGLAVLLFDGLYRCDNGRWCLHSRPTDMPDSHRFNDVAVDPLGRLIAGTMIERGRIDGPPGRLYGYDGVAWQGLADGFGTINGLAFSPDGTRLYMSDSHASVSRVWTAPYDIASGTLGERQDFAWLSPDGGRPDGAAVDASGHYWIAAIGGARLLRFTPRGDLERVVPMPVRWPTKIAFGGERLATLYVTSMMAPEGMVGNSADGAVFACPVPVVGCVVPPLRL